MNLILMDPHIRVIPRRDGARPQCLNGLRADPETLHPDRGSRGVCHHPLRRLWQIRRLKGQYVAVCIVLALIMSRLDYCN